MTPPDRPPFAFRTLTATLFGTFLAASSAQAQTSATPPSPQPAAPQALERVEIRGTRGENDQRRQSTAAKVVVGREEIDKYGDSSVADVLKRLPGITIGGTPGRGGDIRMRGLGSGYTQILVNGERMPQGFSLDTLTPEQIERIEILRAPTAEFGAQAIAGTINIVLREDVRKRLNTLTLATEFENGRPKPSVSWTRADTLDDLSYNLSASLFRQSWLERSQTHTVNQPAGQPTVDKVETSAGRTHRVGGNASGRLQWKLGEGETFALSPYFFYAQAQNWSHSEVTPDTAPPYAATQTPNTSYYGIVSNTAQWQLRPRPGGKLDVKLGGHVSRWGSDATREEYGPAGNGAPLTRLLTNTPRARDNGLNTSGKYTRLLDNDHQLATGWELEMGWRRETQDSLDRVYTLPASVTPLVEDVSAQRLRTALWAQDEWALTPQWALHAGLRWESIRTQSDWTDDQGQAQQVSHQSSVWSPLLHALWHPAPDSKDQWRLSLTRSYKAPTTQQLVARRALSRSYPVTETNTPTTPDRLGNPNLLPELATGVDLAWEHYLGNGGVLSAGLFHRQISNLIRTVTTGSAQTVSWSPVPRYYSQPVNLASARTTGLEFEAKLRASELWTAAPPVDLRGNVSVYRSKVASVPGPDNTLDSQPGWTANLGADYRFKAWPLAIGSNLNYTPDFVTQQSAEQRAFTGTRRVLDAYANWTFSPTALLRLSANNLLPLRSLSGTSYIGTDYASRGDTVTLTATSVTLRLELKL